MWLLINPIYAVNIRTLPAVATFPRGSVCELFMNIRCSQVYISSVGKGWGRGQQGLAHTTFYTTYPTNRLSHTIAYYYLRVTRTYVFDTLAINWVVID